MGTPASVDELVNLVRAALQPEADAASKERAAALLRELVSRDRTLIVATHDQDFAELVATRVLLVTAGVVRAGG